MKWFPFLCFQCFFYFILHVIYALLLRQSLYALKFSASFINTFLSPDIAVPINRHVPFSLSQILMCSIFLEMVLSVCNCWPNVVTSISLIVYPGFIKYSFHCSFSNFIHIYLHILKCSLKCYLSYYFIYFSFANIGKVDKICFSLSS